MNNNINSTYETIFISHAAPEDNYFSGWLASKLKLFGYKVWIDFNELEAGEDFWDKIEYQIRKRAIKFIFVISNTSINKKGTKRELAIADKIHDRKNFILPLRIDNTPYDQVPPEIIRTHIINFNENWGAGLIELLNLLIEENIPKSFYRDNKDILSTWYEGNAVNRNILVNRKEQFVTNWFECVIPEKTHFYRAFNIAAVSTCPFPALVDNNIVMTFSCDKCISKYIKFDVHEEVDTSQLINSKNFDIPPLKISIKDIKPKLVNLLNRSLEFYFKSRGLEEHLLSNNQKIYCFPLGSTVDMKKYSGRTIKLAGKMLQFNWHFSLSGNAFLHPFPGYSFSSHLYFTKSGTPLAKEQQHSLRRKRGHTYNNKIWKNLLLGAMLKLSEGNSKNKLTIFVCCSNVITINNYPVELVCPIGFNEPE